MNERRNGVRHSAESSLKVLFDDVAALLKREICEIEEFARSVGALLNEPHLLTLSPVAAASVEQCHVVACENELSSACIHRRVLKPVDDEVRKLRVKA